MTGLPFSLEATVVIRARRDTVFRFFTDSARFAEWWGQGSEIDPRPGGRVLMRMPGATVARGEVLEIEAARRLVFTFGFERGTPMPVGGSRVTITLEDVAEGTRLRLQHDLATAEARDHHVQGWRYQLAVFANVTAALEHADAPRRVDALFRAWSEPDVAARRRLLEDSVTPDVVFRDIYSATSGLDDLHAHLAAAQVHLPGLRLEREGDLQHCQGTAVARWKVVAADGTVKGQGTNVYDLAPDGRIARCVGLWDR